MISEEAKYSAAQAFATIFSQLGYRVYLGGGGAATVWSGPRPVKDLDFKMGQRLKADWKDEAKRKTITDSLFSNLTKLGYRIQLDNLSSKKQLQYVLRLKIIDRLSDFRVKRTTAKLHKNVVTELGIEISLTSSGMYEETSQREVNVGPALFVRPVDVTQLVLDKVFVFAQRAMSEMPKMLTDFEDLSALLDKHQFVVLTELKRVTQETNLLSVRNEGYLSAAKREKQWHQKITGEVRRRIGLLKPELRNPPPWRPTQDPALRAAEAKFMIERVEKFLVILDQYLPDVT